ncbi:DUF1611 domain-containing protein [Blastopirellula sp. JC732]|uniref:DUF1611 domain-containing protein n=1 Tax=Blastopirellula sediminis TaxID=2894196 RepID=A0A9X1SEZ6_9BACT|nr:DUF1611 domain-containing protein [Blastopirellula sediminis]MCC9607910.1 DUF1611 domain-containing protein [Blastopirellula sediminis]MCC9627297.1 DUF1611 domain-containing protein [Blastopirellula sediminis]
MNTAAISEAACESAEHRLRDHHRIVLLTDGFSSPFLAKTAISMLRYRTADIAAVLESNVQAKTAQEVFNTGGDVPLVADLAQVPDADAVYIGIAPPGGNLPPAWRPILLEAIRRNIDVVSGLHDFLIDDPELVQAAEESGSRLIDVRRNRYRQIASGQPFRKGCVRIHAVGQDCSLGKMVASLEVDKGLRDRGHSTAFIATGQTGIMISGIGVPIDCVVADFVNGTIERFIRQNEEHDFLLIEGQGSISHPAYSAVTAGLLHGAAPDGLIYCYEAGREHVKGLQDIPLRTHQELLKAYEVVSNLRHPCRIIGVAVNTRTLSQDEAMAELERARQEFQLPVCDVYRTGAAELVEAALKLREEVLA